MKAVVTGAKVVKPKETFGKKLRNAFIAPGADSVGQYMVNDVLIPSLRNTLLSAGISMLYYLFQGRKTPQNGPYGGYPTFTGTPFWNPMSRIGVPTTTVNYGGYSTGGVQNPAMAQTQQPQRLLTKPTDVIIPDRGQAELALDSITDVLKQYGSCSLGTFFEIVGVPSNGYTDYTYGWKNLYGVSIKSTAGGYYIDMPRAVPLQ